jgi:hypothetical protein
MPVRRPRGYYGDEHTTLGDGILAVTKILKMPEQVLGKEEFERLKRIKPDAWYPVEWLLGLTEILEAHVGRYGLMQLGRKLYAASHKDRVLQVAKSAKDILYAMDAIYHHSNRGRGIGGWQVLKFGAGVAEIEKNTPQHCVMDQGILTEALLSVGSACNVSQTQCFLEGAETCIFSVSSAFVDKRWSG